MNILLALKQLQLSFGLFFGVKDIIEIIALSSIIYLFSRWLYQDTSKKLLLSFYGYCIVLLCSFSFQLFTLGFILLAAAPAAILLFITVHQKTLQKNFVAFKKVTVTDTVASNWDETLIRECLVVANNNKEITCLIERHESLDQFFVHALPLHGSLDHETLAFITASPLYQEQGMVLISLTGNITAINATWKSPASTPWLTGALNPEKIGEHYALFYSTHFDCIALSITPKRRLFTLIVEGKKHENLSATQALTLVHRHIHASSSLKELSHGSTNPSHTTQRELSH